MELDGRLLAFGINLAAFLRHSGSIPDTCWDGAIEAVGLCARMGENIIQKSAAGGNEKIHDLDPGCDTKNRYGD